MAVMPTTHDFGDGIATSSEANAFIRDPLMFLLNPPRAEVRQATLQSLTTAVWTAITMDAEDLDYNTGGIAQHDNATNNSRFTAVYAGWYLLSGSISFAVNTTGRRGARWAVNGVTANSAEILIPTTAGGVCEIPARVKFVFLAAGDYVELQGFQESGAGLNTNVGSASGQSGMSIVWFGGVG